MFTLVLTALAGSAEISSVTVDFGSKVFFSREIHSESSDRATVVLTANADGSSTLSMEARSRRSHHRSKYVSRTGKHETEKTDSTTGWTATGTWRTTGKTRTFTFTQRAWNTRLDHPFPIQPLELTCTLDATVAPNTYQCIPVGDRELLHVVAVDAFSRQPWTYRNHPRRPAPSGPEQRVLWLGSPHLTLHARQQDRTPAVVTITPSAIAPPQPGFRAR